jgi:ribose transport system permease protein
MSDTAATETAPVAVERAARRRVEVRDFGIVLAFVVLVVALSLATDTFFTTRNILNILDQSAPVGIIACAITICIIAGIFDLSTGAIYGVSAVVATKVANAADPTIGLLAGV